MDSGPMSTVNAGHHGGRPQRAVLSECLDQVFACRDTMTAIRPTTLFEPLLVAARDRVMDGRSRSARTNRERQPAQVSWAKQHKS